MTNMTDVVIPAATVPVQSGWFSKINWTQVVAGVAMIVAFVTGNKLQLDANTQSAIIILIGFISQVTTFVMRQYFTNTVTASSVTPTEKITVTSSVSPAPVK